MWNSYRQCQMHLTNLLDQINLALSKDLETYASSRDHFKFTNETQLLADEVCASIPYMLAGAEIQENKSCGSTWVLPRPPKLLGGFGLQWALFTISILSILPEDVRARVKTVLLWIGSNVGLGQATVLAHVSVPTSIHPSK